MTTCMTSNMKNSKRKYTNKCKREIKRVCIMGRVSLQC